MKIKLYARSSSRDEPYSVDFINEQGRIFIYCDCPAGEPAHGQGLCKHKLKLSCGDSSMLFDKNQINELNQVCEWIKDSELIRAIDELNNTENEVEQIKKRIKKIKGKIAHSMKEGINV